jgi:LacI family transcriptional regulator
MPHITMAQIAARAGVCKASVSLALRNDPRISVETRRRISEIAQEIGYTRHPVLDDLMSQLRRSRGSGYQRTIAFLNAHPDRRAFTENPTIPFWVEGCRNRATYLGYTVDTFWLHDPELDAPRLRRILTTRAIRGAIILGAFGLDSIPPRFASLWNEFACVVTGVRTHQPALSFTCVDHHNLVLEAMNQVRALGYQRPGLVLSHSVDRVTDGRFTCAMWLAQQALPASQRLPALTAFTATTDGFERFAPWFQEHRPDVILTLHTDVRKWTERLGFAAPRDVGLVQLERNRFTPDWSGMDQHNDVAGAAAVDLLVSMLQGHETGVPTFPRATLIGATWVTGTTVCQQDRGTSYPATVTGPAKKKSSRRLRASRTARA